MGAIFLIHNINWQYVIFLYSFTELVRSVKCSYTKINYATRMTLIKDNFQK